MHANRGVTVARRFGGALLMVLWLPAGPANAMLCAAACATHLHATPEQSHDHVDETAPHEGNGHDGHEVDGHHAQSSVDAGEYCGVAQPLVTPLLPTKLLEVPITQVLPVTEFRVSLARPASAQNLLDTPPPKL